MSFDWRNWLLKMQDKSLLEPGDENHVYTLFSTLEKLGAVIVDSTEEGFVVLPPTNEINRQAVLDALSAVLYNDPELEMRHNRANDYISLGVCN